MVHCFLLTGSGKSHLLVAVIVLLSRLFEHCEAASAMKSMHLYPQILVASATNVAVDNILLALMAHEYQDFARVGSVKKIAKPVGSGLLSCCRCCERCCRR